MEETSHANLDISVVIPTHNRSDALDLTLEHLARQDFGGKWEVVVVNNNSTDNTVDVVAEWKRKFPVELMLVSETTPGPAAARNTGARVARGNYLIFIDNDILTNPDFVQRHYCRLKQNPDCWIVGLIRDLPENEATVFGRYKKRLFELSVGKELVESDGFTGAGSSMPKRDFVSLGGFDEQFFVASGEDRELAMRASNRGIKILFDSSIETLHNDWAGTNIRDYCSRQRTYTQTEPIFAQRYGEKNPRLELAVRNSPKDLTRDGIKLYASKLIKSGLGSRGGQSALIGLCELFERIVPETKFLDSLYKLAISGAIYRGYQDGTSRIMVKNRKGD